MRFVLAFALAFLALGTACSDPAKKKAGSCDSDSECQGGVCFDERCYQACTEQNQCADDEFCVTRTATGGETATLCVVAAEHAGCTAAGECADLVAGPCETIECDAIAALCTVIARAEATPCTPRDGGTGACRGGRCPCVSGCAGDVVTPDANEVDVAPDAQPEPAAEIVEPAPEPVPEIVEPAPEPRPEVVEPNPEPLLEVAEPAVEPQPEVTEPTPEVSEPLPEVVDAAPEVILTPPTYGAWHAMSVVNAPAGRIYVGPAWTGTDLCIWGGWNGSNMNVGGCYNAATDIWTTIATAGRPAARSLFPSVATPERYCVWAGYGGGTSGGCLRPADNAWEATVTGGTPTARQNHGAAAIGNEICYWGGRASAGAAVVNTGGCYDTILKTWRSIPTDGAPVGRFNPPFVRVGERLCVFGGHDQAGTWIPDGGCWSPTAAAWAPMAAPPEGVIGRGAGIGATAGRLCAFGGDDGGSGYVATGACYDPVVDAWTELPTANGPVARNGGFAAAWTGAYWCLWAGSLADEVPILSGACYDEADHAWFALPEEGGAAVGSGASGFWTGTEFCAWGGRSSGQNLVSGGCLPIDAEPPPVF